MITRKVTHPIMPTLAISRILCPVDLSDASRKILRQALLVARQHGATLKVIYVLDVGRARSSGEAMFEVTPAMRSTLDEDLHWLVAAAMDAEVQTQTAVCEGPVVPTILHEVRVFQADLIVVGTHGRGGFERMALGSTAEKLVRRAMCPVMVVPPSDAGDAPVLPRLVLCPTDFSPAAAAAIDYARFIAARVGASLSLVAVTEWPFGEAPAPGPVADLLRSIDAEAKRRLDDCKVEGGLPIQTAVLHGKASKQIVEFARRERVGLIVMGARGGGGDALGLPLLGSTTYGVMRDAPCPVLTVRPPGEG
jgi:nucleotide-binding universal stress UspA family protein